ncbi:signal peptidase I [Gryllotalpicola reticulitermitis]|uniref:Signal peptidase I n=1 Tax=Gryllotalpicola reticulitermitis TaxID=1184153 RepID=A0ABV8Q4M4_9MICO
MTESTTDAAERPTTASPQRSAGRSAWVFVRDIIVIVVVALLVSFLIKTFLIRSFYIPSPSMEDTLMVNDRIVVNELEPKLIPVHRGDIVVFTDPGDWLGPDDTAPAATAKNPLARGVGDFLTFIGLGTADSDDHLVKRVIGVPGDHVVCCNALGQVSVNGTPLKEPFVASRVEPGDTDSHAFDVTVPPGDLWVLGDNRGNSADSSMHTDLPSGGFVPEKDVVGRAFVITWPISHWTWLTNYPNVFRGISSK